MTVEHNVPAENIRVLKLPTPITFTPRPAHYPETTIHTQERTANRPHMACTRVRTFNPPPFPVDGATTTSDVDDDTKALWASSCRVSSAFTPSTTGDIEHEMESDGGQRENRLGTLTGKKEGGLCDLYAQRHHHLPCYA